MIAKERDRLRAEEHGMAKLTWGEVCQIRLFGFVGMDRYALAERFHIHRSMVDNILGGRNWRETPEQRALFEEYWAGLAHT
jgi:hypothetical protein